MTPFQKEYILRCLQVTADILSDGASIEASIEGATGGDRTNPRYYYGAKMTDAALWQTSQVLELSATIFETTARVFKEYNYTEFEDVHRLNEAKDLFCTEYLRLITEDVDHLNVRTSVRNNIIRILSEMDPASFRYLPTPLAACTAAALLIGSFASWLFLSPIEGDKEVAQAGPSGDQPSL